MRLEQKIEGYTPRNPVWSGRDRMLANARCAVFGDSSSSSATITKTNNNQSAAETGGLSVGAGAYATSNFAKNTGNTIKGNKNSTINVTSDDPALLAASETANTDVEEAAITDNESAYSQSIVGLQSVAAGALNIVGQFVSAFTGSTPSTSTAGAGVGETTDTSGASGGGVTYLPTPAGTVTASNSLTTGEWLGIAVAGVVVIGLAIYMIRKK